MYILLTISKDGIYNRSYLFFRENIMKKIVEGVWLQLFYANFIPVEFIGKVG